MYQQNKAINRLKIRQVLSEDIKSKHYGLGMILPDEEEITYSYNLGGQLEKVHGYKSYGYDYVSKIGYDKFEQRTYLKYCDGPSILADKNIPISLYWYKK